MKVWLRGVLDPQALMAVMEHLHAHEGTSHAPQLDCVTARLPGTTGCATCGTCAAQWNTRHRRCPADCTHVYVVAGERELMAILA